MADRKQKKYSASPKRRFVYDKKATAAPGVCSLLYMFQISVKSCISQRRTYTVYNINLRFNMM